MRGPTCHDRSSRARRTGARPTALVAAALFLLPSPVLAIGEILVDVGVGEAFPHASNLTIEQPQLGNDFTIHDLEFDDRSLEDPPFYRAQVSYFLRGAPWVGFAIDFVHLKRYARTRDTKRIVGELAGVRVDEPLAVQSVVQSFSVSHGLNYLAFEVLVRHGFGRRTDEWPLGRIQVQGGLGAGPVIAHAENEVAGERLRERYVVSGLGILGSATIRAFPITRFGAWLALQSSLSSVDVPVGAGGEARFTDWTPQILFGITYRATRPAVDPGSPLSPRR